jgi:cob(I)alamin adenosyltransferase
MLDKGYIQVYTGNGKGKTTAALGIALRTICAGNKVFMGQFMKGQSYSELKATELLPGLVMEQFGDPEFFKGKPAPKDYENAQKGLARIREVIIRGEYDMVILDEVNTTLFFKLLEVKEVLEVLSLKPENMELILTGRYASDEIMEAADLVTEMKEIKHYYTKGVMARTGIES